MIYKLKSTGVQQAFWTISEQGFSSLAVFVTGILLARATTKDDFGMYILGLSVVMIAIGFQRAVITTPYTILFRQQEVNDRSKYRYASLIFQNLFLLISLLLFIVSVFTMAILGLSDYIQFAIFLFIFFIGQATLYFFKYTLIAELNVKKNFIYCMLIYCITLIVLLSFYLYGNLNTNITYSIIGISAITSSVGFYLLFFQTSLEKINIESLKECFAKNWKLGKWIVGSNVGFMFSSQIFPWLLLYFWNKASVAELGVVLSATRILAPAVQGVWSFLLPKMTTYITDKSKFVLVLKQLISIMFLAALILVGIGYLFGEWIIELLYSSKYSGLGLMITLGFVLQGINFINMPIDAALNALKRTDYGFMSAIIGVIVTIIFGLPLTLKLGVIGALIGMIVAAFASTVYRSYKLKQLLKGSI